MTKLYFLFIIIISSLNSTIAQKPSYKYFNQIGEVEVLNANDSKISIKKANNVLFTINLNTTTLLVKDYIQFKDNKGKWETIFTLIDTSQLICDFNVTFKFSSPILGSFQEPNGKNEASIQLSTFHNKEKTMIQFRGTVSSSDGILIGFLSNEKITTEIKGIIGVL